MASITIPDMPELSPLSIAAGVVLSYLALQKLLRYNRIKRLHKKYNIDSLTLSDAEIIMRTMGQYEFPYVYKTSLEFALFRTYAIPTISSLLDATKQFAHPVNSHRRYTDTGVLIGEIMSNPLDSPRPKIAFQRLNFLHGRHGDKISNDDLLYTLALFMCQPVVFIDNWEWRGTTPLERKAQWLFWSNVGQRMNIHSIPDSYEGMKKWADEYEEKYMVPAQSNHDVAEYTTNLLIYFIPNFAKKTARDLILSVLDERLRIAMLYPPPPSYAVKLQNAIIAMRRFYLKHLAPPRIIPFSTTHTKAIDESKPVEERRYFYKLWGVQPWYVENNWWNRWSITGLTAWGMGLPMPGGAYYGERGYNINEIGPRGLEKVGPGHERARKGNNKMQEGEEVEVNVVGDDAGEGSFAKVGGGCPVAFAH